MVSSDKPLILVADDDPQLLEVLRFRFEELGYRAACAPDKQRLLDLLCDEEPVLLLLDLQFGVEDGVQVLRDLLANRPHLCVVMFTAYASVETAVAAIQLGAFDYLTKPVDLNRVRVLVERAIDKHVLSTRLKRLEEMLVERESGTQIVGDSPAMRSVRELITSVATTDATVLILGETGTGKELVARSLHEQSVRRRGPFVPVNMAALPRELAESTLFGHEKGAFTGAHQTTQGCCEMADKGTLFLDEIGELEASLQAKLLRFLQDRSVQRVGSGTARKVDVRVVAATNRDLAARVRAGLFREDLYYRLHVVPIAVPPLRELRQDIPLFAAYFVQRAAARYRKDLGTFSELALQTLQAYDWPGNVRQLEHVIERIAILSKRPGIEQDQLPPEVQRSVTSSLPVGDRPPQGPRRGTREIGQGTDDVQSMEHLEQQAILHALQRTEGNVQQAANLLGLGQATIYRKIKRYGIPMSVRKRASGDEG